jgi:hypothetical protein
VPKTSTTRRLCRSDPLIAMQMLIGHLRMFNARIRDQWIAPTVERHFEGIEGYSSSGIFGALRGSTTRSIRVPSPRTT